MKRFKTRTCLFQILQAVAPQLLRGLDSKCLVTSRDKLRSWSHVRFHSCRPRIETRGRSGHRGMQLVDSEFGIDCLNPCTSSRTSSCSCAGVTVCTSYGQQIIDLMLQPIQVINIDHIHPFMAAASHPLSVCFQQDDAPGHKAKLVPNWFQEHERVESTSVASHQTWIWCYHLWDVVKQETCSVSACAAAEIT